MSIGQGLTLIHDNRAESLCELITRWMTQQPLPSLFEDEVVLVHSRGMAQWLKLHLAEHSAARIAAGIQFELPSGFLWRMYRQVLGHQSVPEESPFDKAPLTWHLYSWLPTWVQRPELSPLKAFLEDDDDGQKHYQLAAQLADLFDQYQVYRADWLERWAAGSDQIQDGQQEWRDLPPDQAWQAHLWRAISASLAADAHTHRAAVHQRFVEKLHAPRKYPFKNLPPRVIVFGISSLPAQTVEALYALSRHCQIIMAIHNPCRHYWGDIQESRLVLRQAARARGHARIGWDQPPALADLSHLHTETHPLLAAWGKQGRDFIRLLNDDERWAAYQAELGHIELFDDTPPAPDTSTLLQKVQWSICDLQAPPDVENGVEAWSVHADDRSIEFHIAHSALREVEILHDQLLDMFADPALNLQPREVMVMMPDLATYAPLVEAVFGHLDRDDARYIPYAISDQADRQSQVLWRALETLLHLPELRFSGVELLDLLDVPAFQRRFDFSQADIGLLRRWIEGSGVRWGLHQAHREALGLGAKFDENSWMFGLRRMLLGYAVGDAGEWQSIWPYDEVAGLEADLAGRLAACVAVLEHYWSHLSKAATPEQWQARLLALLDDTLALETDTERQLQTHLETALDAWRLRCTTAHLDATPLPLVVVRDGVLKSVLEDMDGGSVALHFLAGRVNFGTLMPMRAIPFKVVCLLGMNDGDYPRYQPPLSFDLMAQHPRAGDRSRREDDRYLLLEALLSARERLYLSYVGRNIHTDAPRPPSVLITQLRDYLGRVVQLEAGQTAQDFLQRLTVEHPLQPFSVRYFTPQADPRLLSYAKEWCEVHTPLESSPAQLVPLTHVEPVDVRALGQFLKSPTGRFFQERLGVRFEEETQQEEHEPFALGPLDHFQIKQRLFEALREHIPAYLPTDDDEIRAVLDLQFEPIWQANCAALRGEGRLPVGLSGQRLLESLRETVFELWQHWCMTRCEYPTSLSARALSITLDGIDISGTLDALYTTADTASAMPVQLLVHTGNSFSLGTLAQHWPRHLLASAAGYPVTTLILGEVENKHAGSAQVVWPPLSTADAIAHLKTIIDARQHGLCAPLAVGKRCAQAWLEIELAPNDKFSEEQRRERAYNAARDSYEGGYQRRGENETDLALRRAYPDFDALVEAGFEHWVRTLYQALYAFTLFPAQESAQ